jgi:hypothetical protein
MRSVGMGAGGARNGRESSEGKAMRSCEKGG